MKSLYSVILLCLLLHGVYGQAKITIDPNSSKISYNAYELIVNHIKSIPNCEITPYGYIRLTPNIVKTGGKLIEGMENKTVEKIVLSLKIRNNISNADTTLRYEEVGATAVGKNSDYDLVNKLLSDGKLSTSLTSVFKSYSNMDCNAVQKKLKSLLDKDEVHEGMKSVALIKVNKICEIECAAIIKAIEDKYALAQCTKNLEDAKILIASGTDYNINRAVNLLIDLPPHSSCKAEVEKVVEMLSQKTNLKEEKKTALTQYKTVYYSGDNSGWYKLLIVD
jgi:hypothetical protein